MKNGFTKNIWELISKPSRNIYSICYFSPRLLQNQEQNFIGGNS